jgi:hypothetical protein
MSRLMTHGLSALMEACKLSEAAEKEDDSLIEAFEAAIDDDIKNAVTNNMLDDSVESDMDGEGVGDDSEMEELLSKIPPSDRGIDKEIEDLVESMMPGDLAAYY